MEFSIDLLNLKQCALRIENLNNELQYPVSMVDNVCDGLTRIGLGEIENNVKEIYQQILRRRKIFQDLSDGLNKIIKRCLLSENRILSEFTDVVGIAGQMINNSTDTGSSVFTDDGMYYGANQQAPDFWQYINEDEYNSYLDIVQSYFPDMTRDEAKAYLKKLRQESCSYVSMINSIFEYYEGRPEEFEETFGYSMYNEEGQYNFNALLVDLYCQEDNHCAYGDVDAVNLAEDLKWVDYDGDGNGNWVEYGHGVTEENMKYRWEQYCANHGIDVNYEIGLSITPETYADYAQDGMVSISCDGFTLYDSEGNASKYDFCHCMTITGVSENGNYIVSSWGEKYELNPDEITGSTAVYEVISYK